MKQLGADALELPVDRQRSPIKIYIVPSQAEQLALAQTEDQDVGGVERVPVGACRLQEPACFLA